MNMSKLLILVILTTLFLTGCKQEDSKLRERPNVLFIALDDLRPELPGYGASHIQAPNFDRLSQISLQFNRAYAQIAVCGASRASLMTGTRPDFTQVHDYQYTDYFVFDHSQPKGEGRFGATGQGNISLLSHFYQNGYYTACIGKIHHYSQGDQLNFHEYEPTSYHWRANWMPLQDGSPVYGETRKIQDTRSRLAWPEVWRVATPGKMIGIPIR